MKLKKFKKQTDTATLPVTKEFDARRRVGTAKVACAEQYINEAGCMGIVMATATPKSGIADLEDYTMQ
jgi:hypothetical protein